MNRYTTVPVGKANVPLFTENDRVVAHHLTDGFEPETRKLMGRLFEEMAPEHAFLDIGAYTGLYGLAAAILGYPSFMFEPNPIVYNRLVLNTMEVNREYPSVVGRAHAINLALTSDWRTPGNVKDLVVTMPFYAAAGMTSGGSLEETFQTSRIRGVYEVSATLLDSWVEKNAHVPPVGLIKIDVEGHENEVQTGGMTLIERDHPDLIIEALTPEAKGDLSHMLDYEYEVIGVLDGRNVYLSARPGAHI